MKKLLVIATTLIPEMKIIEKIHTISSEILKGDTSKKKKHELCMYGQMLGIKQMVGTDMDKAMTVMDDFNDIEQARGLFKSKKN